VHAFLHTRTDTMSYRLFRRARTLALVTFARYFACSNGLRQALTCVKETVFNFNPGVLFGGVMGFGLSLKDFAIVGVGILVLLLIGNLQERGVSITGTFAKQNIWFRWGVYALIIAALLYFSMDSQNAVKEFIYANY
jgi:hypothetical protein